MIAVSGTPRSSADCTAQRPVPFCSASSTIASTSAPPVASRLRSTVGGDLDQVGVEVALLPFLEDAGDRLGVEPVDGLQEIVGFGDELHVGVFDAVVHHLHVVAGALRTDVGDAGRAIDLRRHLAHDRLDAAIGFRVAARHHARAVERPLLAAGDAHADEADAGVLQRARAAVGVGELRVAAVDQDVARLEMRHAARRSRRRPACPP